MQATRWYWELLGLTAVLATLAIVLARPVGLLGAAGLGAWILARYLTVHRAADTTTAACTTAVHVDRERVPIDQEVTVHVAVSFPPPPGHDVSITAEPPVAAVAPPAADRTVVLEPGEDSADLRFSLRFPFAGTYEIPPPTLMITDRGGLFRTTITPDSQARPTVVVEARQPRDVYLGQGGDQFSATYGDHDSDQTGAGTIPAEIREYAPGDAMRRIDWRATARLNDLYVREYDTETDRTMVLLLDTRERMETGTPGDTQFDYARHVALTLVETAADHDDPIGLFAIDANSLFTREHPTAQTQQYVTLKETLHQLQSAPGHATRDRPAPGHDPRMPVRPSTVRQKAASLRSDQSAFTHRVRPFLDDVDPYRQQIEGDPLVETARVHLPRLQGTVWTALFTDDSDRARTLETVKLARRNNNYVVVFLTPDVLFEPAGLSDLERAYERYIDFVGFRQDLARLDRVTVFEVGPADRIEALLARPRTTRGRPA